MSVTIGNFLAAAFVYGIAVVVVLALFAELEEIASFWQLRVPRELRPPGSRMDVFLKRNAAINGAAAAIAVAILIALAIVKSVVDEMMDFLDWTKDQPLVSRALFMLVVGYLLLSVTLVASRFARDDANALLTRATGRLAEAFQKRDPDLDDPDLQALLRYSHQA